MSNDKTKLTNRLDRLAEVLTATANYSAWAQLVYEAKAEIDRLDAERNEALAKVAVLREALKGFIDCDPSFSAVTIERLEGMRNDRLAQIVLKARLALADTDAAAREYEREKRNAVLEELSEPTAEMIDAWFSSADSRKKLDEFCNSVQSRFAIAAGYKRMIRAMKQETP